MKALEREIKIMKMVSHPHIIYLHKVYECSSKIFLVMELCYGDLSSVMKDGKVFSEIEARRLVRDMVNAVTYLHKNGR